MSEHPVKIVVNGEDRFVSLGCSIKMLLDEILNATEKNGPTRLNAVAVELNGELVARQRFENITLEPDDSVEVVTLVGGG